MPHLTNVQVQFALKIKILGQNRVYGEDLRPLTSKTKNLSFPEDLENTPFNDRSDFTLTY
jgi:hypothetical protein